jgi:uncharacterized protein
MPSIDPKNLTAQWLHAAAGNPPTTRPDSAIGNCFPGLEFDFRNVWRRVLVGVVLHEADNLVVAVDPAAAAEVRALLGKRLVSVNGVSVITAVTGPRTAGGPSEQLIPATNLEWTNALADVVTRPGSLARCAFQDSDANGLPTGPVTTIDLEVRALLDGAALSRDAVEPGELTQSLCSPWQNDYRECGCYYWAASRPDFVSVDATASPSRGHNWLQRTGRPPPPRITSRKTWWSTSSCSPPGRTCSSSSSAATTRSEARGRQPEDAMSILSLPLVAEAPRGPAPAAPEGPAECRRFEAGGRAYLFIADGSQVYEVDGPAFDALLGRLPAAERGKAALAALGAPRPRAVADRPPESAPLQSQSLAVAQKCNLGCSYCYAQEGQFGGEARAMPLAVARAAVERLVTGCPPGGRVQVSFLGGEPLLARAVVRDAAEHAARLGRARGVRVGLSITTNGTLVTPDDGEFFERHGFAVTVSLDGVGAAHDRQRPFRGGRGSLAQVLANVLPLLGRQRRMQVSARVTVTPQNLELRRTLDAFIALGFHSVGFSPTLSSPTGRGEMGGDDLRQMLAQMVECGREFERRVTAGRRYPFLNLVTALRELHRGTHRPYPCGAGGGYFGVSADGELSACHRFVGDAAGAMGDLASGVDPERQARWLTERHVHRQEPCRSCWARYLCGGGCHHEVLHRGRPACEYIGGWLHYCLQAYARLLAARPDYFAGAAPAESSETVPT